MQKKKKWCCAFKSTVPNKGKFPFLQLNACNIILGKVSPTPAVECKWAPSKKKLISENRVLIPMELTIIWHSDLIACHTSRSRDKRDFAHRSTLKSKPRLDQLCVPADTGFSERSPRGYRALIDRVGNTRPGLLTHCFPDPLMPQKICWLLWQQQVGTK